MRPHGALDLETAYSKGVRYTTLSILKDPKEIKNWLLLERAVTDALNTGVQYALDRWLANQIYYAPWGGAFTTRVAQHRRSARVDVEEKLSARV